MLFWDLCWGYCLGIVQATREVIIVMALQPYKCNDCHFLFEILESHQHTLTCPACRSVNIEKDWSQISTHSQIDGDFDTIPAGKKIEEKNNILKKRWEGYEGPLGDH